MISNNRHSQKKLYNRQQVFALTNTLHYTMSAQVAITPASEPTAPRSSLYTCLACQVAFHSSEKQRNHYRTE
jgi:hypothetical protein